jgi:hypothetical protein
MRLGLHHKGTVGVKVDVIYLEFVVVGLLLKQSPPESVIRLPFERIFIMVKAIWAEDEETELIRVGQGLVNDDVRSPLGVDLIADNEGAEEEHGEEGASFPIAPPPALGRKGLGNTLFPHH